MMEGDNMKNKAIRLNETWEYFIREHPDLKVIKDGDNIQYIEFPEDAENITLVIVHGKVYNLSYNSSLYPDMQRYQSEDARNSVLYRIFEDFS